MQLVAFAMLEREATLLGDSLRRRVVGGTIETDPPQAELPSSPREHRLKGARRQAAAAPFERNHERNIGDVARGSELDGADCLPIEPTSDRKGVTSSVAPVATELPDNVGVVGVRRRSGLRDRPAKEPRCCWIFGEPAMRCGIPGEPAGQLEGLVEVDGRRFAPHGENVGPSGRVATVKRHWRRS